MAHENINEVITQRLSEAFAPAVAAGVDRDTILADIKGTTLEPLGPQALCRAQWNFILRRHEALHGPLPQAVAAGAR